MIPDEAVDAAAKIVYRTSGRKRVMSYEQARPTCRDEAREILEAAAPHLQPTVTTVEELDALPEGAMVRTDGGFYLKEALRRGISTWVTTDEQYYFKSADIPLPATVIYRGQA